MTESPIQKAVNIPQDRRAWWKNKKTQEKTIFTALNIYKSSAMTKGPYGKYCPIKHISRAHRIV